MKWLIPGVCFLTGLTFGFIGRQFCEVDFEGKFDIADVLTLLATIAVAALVQYHWTKRYSDVRAEKDLLISDVKEIIAIASEVRTRFLFSFNKQELSEEDFRSIKAGLKNWGSAMSLLETSLKEAKLPEGITKLNRTKEWYFEYKRFLTGGEYLKPYSHYTHNASEQKFLFIRNELQSLIRAINRH